jgi:hypothetical protein
MGQHDAAADAVEQLDAIAALERCDRSTRRRLRQVELPRGLGDVLPVGHRSKDPELFERHGGIIPQA